MPLMTASKLFDELTSLEPTDEWPSKKIKLCAKYGIYDWLTAQSDTMTNNQVDIANAFLQLSACCQITSFLIVQSLAAYLRILDSGNDYLNTHIIKPTRSGKIFITNALSQVMTSCQHRQKSTLDIQETQSHIILTGFTPWVSGAAFSDYIIVAGKDTEGATLSVAVPMTTDNISIEPPTRLLAFNTTYTSRVIFKNTKIEKKWLINKIDRSEPPYQTKNTWITYNCQLRALGLCSEILDFIDNEIRSRPALHPPFHRIKSEYDRLLSLLLKVIGESKPDENQNIHCSTNDLVMRVAQVALVITKGHGYTMDHPAQKWCREALFYRVHASDEVLVLAQLKNLTE